MIQITAATLNELMGAKTFLPFSGFIVVTSAMTVAEENLFTFSNNSQLCLHFKAEDCNAISYTCKAYKQVSGQWVDYGTHVFNADGHCRSLAVNWDHVLMANID